MFTYPVAKALLLSFVSISLSYAVTQEVKSEVVSPEKTEAQVVQGVIHLKNKKELDEAIQYTGPKVLKFSTAWCGPCRRIEKDIEKLAEQYPQVRVYVINDNNDFRSSMETYKVGHFPTLIFLPSNKRFEGARTVAEYEAAFKEIAPKN